MAEVQALPGKRMVSYFRLLKNANKEDAELVPLEGDSSLSLKRDTKSVTTKSGNISTSSGLTTEIDQTFYEGISKVSDEFYDAILEDQTVEYWLVDLDRQNRGYLQRRPFHYGLRARHLGRCAGQIITLCDFAAAAVRPRQFLF